MERQWLNVTSFDFTLFNILVTSVTKQLVVVVKNAIDRNGSVFCLETDNRLEYHNSQSDLISFI